MILGINPFNKKPVGIPNYPPWKTDCIVGKAGQGKTILMIGMISQQYGHRRIIIIDPKDEYSEIAKPNMTGLIESTCVPHLTLKDFILPISEFNQPSDWASLGFADKGSHRMARWATWKDVHNNDPDLFRIFLERLPISTAHLRAFNADPLNNGSNPLDDERAFPVPVHEGAKNAMVDQFNTIKYVFEGEKIQLINKEMMITMFRSNPVIRIHVGAFVNEHELAKGRAIVAKILEWLACDNGKLLKMYKPCIYVDEADKLCPSKSPNDVPLSTSIQFKNYTMKYRAYGVQMTYAFQSVSEFDTTLWQNSHYKVIGRIDEWTPWIETIRILQWRPEDNIRQFALIHPNGWAEIFNPYPCPTQHAGYKFDFQNETFIY